MAECPVYDVGDRAHPAAPVDIAGYDPVIHHQTGSMMPTNHWYSGIQFVYDVGDGDGG